ncbi:metal-dependent hydrolase [Desertihabitans brevis]|nr:metal-dependent hydrolase [Desertihabitans brevis]
MGRTHALSGVAAYLAVATVPGSPLLAAPGSGLLFGAVMAGGAAMLPDLDHPQASISRSLGPLTGVAARTVAALSGGHRQGTHSLLGVLIASMVTFLLAQHPVAGAGWAAFLLAIAISAIGGEGRATRSAAVVGFVAGGIALVALAFLSPPAAMTAVVAVGVGTSAHIVGDMLTREGVPLLWPWRHRQRLAGLSTGGLVEQWIVAPVLAVAILWLSWLVMPELVRPITGAAGELSVLIGTLS